jgi:hypothetical protein
MDYQRLRSRESIYTALYYNFTRENTMAGFGWVNGRLFDGCEQTGTLGLQHLFPAH